MEDEIEPGEIRTFDGISSSSVAEVTDNVKLQVGDSVFPSSEVIVVDEGPKSVADSRSESGNVDEEGSTISVSNPPSVPLLVSSGISISLLAVS